MNCSTDIAIEKGEYYSFDLFNLTNELIDRVTAPSIRTSKQTKAVQSPLS